MTPSEPRESAAERDRRHRKRVGFDSIARDYDASRPTYPACLVSTMVDLSGTSVGAPVLEVGCGTGQLTRDLARHDVALIAIDPGPSMVETARHQVGDATVEFVVTTFEDYDSPPDRFRLIVSAAAFHWVDPEVWWLKTHGLLEEGGWLAILDYDTLYEPSLQSRLRELWIRHSETGAAWASAPSITMRERFESSGNFDRVRHEAHTEEIVQSAAEVQARAETTATFLAYSATTQLAYRNDLAALLAEYGARLTATHTSSLWMARARR